MDSLDVFLHRLLDEGQVVFRGPPAPAGPGDRDRAADRLRRAYATYRLEVAGPLIDFDAAVAVAAGELVRRACWALVGRDEPTDDLEGRITMPMAPTRPEHHLSADLTLRYLPQVHRRARALHPDDPLSTLLARVLRLWSLSGVLADLDEGPETAPEFGGHPGLALLYAERLSRDDRPPWRPGGPGRKYLELVLAGGGSDA